MNNICSYIYKLWYGSRARGPYDNKDQDPLITRNKLAIGKFARNERISGAGQIKDMAAAYF
jgi:hypothetical protein